MGALYGKGDYIESISICTRCGQDTDSNVGNCGGIMGTLIGYEGLPATVKKELDPYMDRDYIFTTLSINSASDLCCKLALENIQRCGGSVDGDTATIRGAEQMDGIKFYSDSGGSRSRSESGLDRPARMASMIERGKFQVFATAAPTSA